jgi:hypothetical protein
VFPSFGFQFWQSFQIRLIRVDPGNFLPFRSPDHQITGSPDVSPDLRQKVLLFSASFASSAVNGFVFPISVITVNQW